MQVDRTNVLQAARLLVTESDRLDDVLVRVRYATHDNEPCGGDPVSADAAIAFPERIAALVEGCQAHNDALRAAAAELRAVALTYGFTEAEIAASVPTMGPIATALGAVDAVDRAR